MMKKLFMTAAVMLMAAGAQAAVVGPDTVNTNANTNLNTNTNANTNLNANTQGQAQGQFQGQVLNSNNEAFAVSGSVSNANNRNTVDNKVVVQGDSINYETAASSAASVFSSQCSGGVSGQTEKFGFSLGEPDAVCQNLLMADAYFKKASMTKGTVQTDALNQAFAFIDDAGYMVTTTNGISKIEKVVKKSVVPALAVTGALCLVSSGSFCPF